METPQGKLNVVALGKLHGNVHEKYVFRYDNESKDACLQVLGKFASDKELSFNWYDAAVLSQKVRRLHREALKEKE